MRETRKRGVLATEEGVQKLEDARAKKRNDKDKPWTYADVAQKTGLDEKTIGRFFRREQPVDESSARAICQQLSVDVNEVVDFSLRSEEDRKGQLGSNSTNMKSSSPISQPNTCERVQEQSTSTTQGLTASASVEQKQNPKQKAKRIVIELGGIDLPTFLSDKEIQAAVLLLLQKASKDSSLKYEEIEKGSIKITLSGSPEGLERLADLIRSGELSEVLEYPIEDAKLVVENTKEGEDNTEFFDKFSLIEEIITQGARGRNLSGANLSDADLSGANLSDADLSGANLSDANLIGANLSSANLSSANLSSANLSDANLGNANLSNADLSNAILSSTNFRNAILTSTDLRSTVLFVANLIDATLIDANLIDANLIGANLIGANLIGADVNRVKVNKALFGNNLGISETMKHYLIQQGAIFQENSGERHEILAV